MKFFSKIIIYFVFLLLSFQTKAAQINYENSFSDGAEIEFLAFSTLKDIAQTVDEETYNGLMRESVIRQPEYRSSTALSDEKRLLLTSAKREYFPTINSRIINDEIIDKNIAPTQSIRKRQDDSFDAIVEINQNIYTGGKIIGGVNFAKLEDKSFQIRKKQVISELILSANHIYLSAYISKFLYEYAYELIELLKPYRKKIKDRVAAGVADPVDLAIFSVNMNELESLLYDLEASAKRDQANYEYFFAKDTSPQGFPLFTIKKDIIYKGLRSFSTEIQELEYEKSLQEVKIVRSDYLPKLGFSLRYTEYDIDKNDLEDNDIRGGLFLNVPLVDFGRGRTKINAAKAKARSFLMEIDVDRKKSDSIEKEILAKFSSALNARNQLLLAFTDTKNQRKIIENRINISGFVASTLVNTAEKEIQQLQILLTSEYDLISSYFELAHQRQMLASLFYIGQ